ncbi:MAG: phenylalanine--tRNA ligase subunit beta, partial [Armatimonadetes bacterium]|nr:phenylalanine--tRNA ligase subunit beta [Anaerolineae bacterium]
RLGLREHITYRFTTPEREALLNAPLSGEYVLMLNAITADKTALRQSLLPNLLDVTRANLRFTPAVQVFEIGAVYFYPPGVEMPEGLPAEPRRLAIILSGQRDDASWLGAPDALYDFYDLKGIVEQFLAALHLTSYQVTRAQHPSLHPGRSAALSVNGIPIGVFGELHPLVAQSFDVDGAPVLAAEFDLDPLLAQLQPMHRVASLPITPAVLEDISLVVKDDLPAAEVEAVIRQAGGDLLKAVTLFDVYRGAPIPDGHKSLAYRLTYQTDERTLNDKEVAAVRKKIVKSAEARLGAALRA